MLPTPAILNGLRDKNFTLGKTLGVAHLPTDRSIVHEIGLPAVFNVSETMVWLDYGDTADSGLWVPYATGCSVVGYTDRGTTWAASGPFSGCEFAVGAKMVNNAASQLFAAHLARESGATTQEVWNQYVRDKNLRIWYENKIPLPSDSFFACSYVFADLGATGITSLIRVDVNTGTQMGGSDGKIFNVKIIK